MTVFGWDASDFDWDRGPMDLASAASSGIEFFTHKATEGTRTLHRHFGEAIGRARTAGIRYFGAYVVPRTPGNGGHGTIAAQVDYFLRYVTNQVPWWPDWPGWFWQVDLEHWGYDDVAPQHGVEACRLLRDRTGKRVVLYAPRWAYGNTIGGSDPLWASDYGANPVAGYRDVYVRRGSDGASVWDTSYSGRRPLIWQFGSNTIIGRQPTCDANAFRGTVADLHRFVTGEDPGIMADPQLLNGWPQPVESDGHPDSRGPGIWMADTRKFIWHGAGAYDQDRRDPASGPSGLYLDDLIKLARDYAKSAADNSAALLARPAAGLTDEQVGQLAAALIARPDNPLGAADQPAIREALRAELANLTLRAQ